VKDVAKTYSPKEVESKWYSSWIENNYFHSVPDNREPYTIVIPPPQCYRRIAYGAYAQ